MNAARIDLMASAVGKIGGVIWHHVFLVATDASGAQAYLRAGPQCLPLERLAGRKTERGDPLEDYAPPPAGPYGAIAVASGAYEPGGVDFDPAAANTTLASGPAAARLWNELDKAASALADEQIPYDPAGKGANWAIVETLRRCGVAAKLPPKRWVPGAGVLRADSPARTAPTRRIGQAVVVP